MMEPIDHDEPAGTPDDALIRVLEALVRYQLDAAAPRADDDLSEVA
jgi:hypothetical protein